MTFEYATVGDDDVIDIDIKPTIAHEFAAAVVMESGKPRLVPTDPGRWLAVLLKLTGPIKITIERLRKRRSAEANAYYWAVVLADTLAGLRQMAADVGAVCPYRNDEKLHEAMKYRFLGVESVKLPGVKAGLDTMEQPATTTKLDSKQFALYVDSVMRWGAERGIYVREPGESVGV